MCLAIVVMKTEVCFFNNHVFLEDELGDSEVQWFPNSFLGLKVY